MKLPPKGKPNILGKVAQTGLNRANSVGNINTSVSANLVPKNNKSFGGGGCNTNSGGGNTGPQAAATLASSGDWAGSFSAGLGGAIGQKNGKKVGGRLGKLGIEAASKLVNVQGVSPSSGIVGSRATIGGGISSQGVSSAKNIAHPINSKQGKENFIKGIGVGNFSLNSTYEDGILSSLKTANKFGKSTLLNKTKAGPAISAASALGIDIKGASDLGINSEDSSMFKIFKLASFGIRSICASLKNKKGYGSKTEESLGWLLSFGINLELLGLLMSIFNRLRNLKFNFGSMLDFDLDNILFDLCDWINQVEMGSSLTDTLLGETQKLLDPREKTSIAGNLLKDKGTFDVFAKGNKDFAQEFLMTEEEKCKLKESAKSFGSFGMSLQKGNNQVATVGFDPLSGLLREKQAGSSTLLKNAPSIPALKTASDAGDINYESFSDNTKFETTGIKKESSVTSIDVETQQVSVQQTSEPQYQVPTNTSQTQTDTQQVGSIPQNETTSPTRQQQSQMTPQAETSLPQTQEITKESSSPVSTSGTLVGAKQTSVSPTAINSVVAAPENPDTITSFHTGEEITRDSLRNTPLQNADMNAVALLHPEDFEVLKNTRVVEQSIKQASDASDNMFNTMMQKTEQEAIEQGGGSLIFGQQIGELSGNQIILNSERVLLSSKSGEMVSYAKGKYAIATDGEMTLNAVKRVVTTTSEHTSVISPTIHLGEYITTRHPVLKGDVAVSWLSGLCGWLSGHIHHDPYISTGSPAQQGQLAGLRATLPTLLSQRVFIAG